MAMQPPSDIWVRLLLALLQLAVLIAWGLQPQAMQSPLLLAMTALTALATFFWLLWLLPLAYRSILWRRRRSVRPSREVQAERRRIAAALHDGVGSQLVQAMLLLDETPGNEHPVQAMLEQSLLDLRWIVDSMDGQGDALIIRLARFRHRLQAVTERRGMHLYWEVWDPEFDEASLGRRLPAGAMAEQIMAILQEAASNVLQHSQATELWITLEPFDPASNKTPGQVAVRVAAHSFAHAQLSIRDNGRGLEVQTPSAGLGLSSMRRRAAEIGAQLQLQPREGGGVSVLLYW
ncbi:ATP-binding protein [Comamonas sp. lk]|uniref:sensor histidine kinase n=1 Tax=Comamonas sp. lk TaxID=2201272 RepID=UPI000EAF70B7|nr:ATP-binding protein [Comamonas sp. lk]